MARTTDPNLPGLRVSPPPAQEFDALAASGSELVTASIRRISLAGEEESLVDLIAGRAHFLPNTAG
ncbi:MAG TPA: hypothetical protein PKA95_17295, partial [Thermomicrobiales bacterium]|nr:hypothetical protein [Thermomicrobiales bacterium]